MTVFFILSRIASNDVLEFYQPENYWICILKELLLWNLAPLKSYNKKEKSLRHVAIVAKFLDDNKPKRLLKCEFALFQTLSILFNFI